MSQTIYLVELRDTAARSTVSSYSSEAALFDSLNADTRSDQPIEGMSQALKVLSENALMTLSLSEAEARAWADLHKHHDIQTYRVAAARVFDELAANLTTHEKAESI